MKSFVLFLTLLFAFTSCQCKVGNGQTISDKPLSHCAETNCQVMVHLDADICPCARIHTSLAFVLMHRRTNRSRYSNLIMLFPLQDDRTAVVRVLSRLQPQIELSLEIESTRPRLSNITVQIGQNITENLLYRLACRQSLRGPVPSINIISPMGTTV